MRDIKINSHHPARLVLGYEVSKDIENEMACFGTKVAIMAGVESAYKSGLLSSVVAALQNSGKATAVIRGIKTNPALNSILEIKNNLPWLPDVILAIGGGSVIDAAKLLSVIVVCDSDPWELRVTGSISVPGMPSGPVPVVTMPTIGGSGTEVSPAALITHDRKKEVFFSPHLFPKVAIVDPDLAVTAPLSVSIQSGFDALVQGLEAYVSSQNQPLSDCFARGAIEHSFKGINLISEKAGRRQARFHLALAGIFSSYAIGEAGVGAVHALSNPISGRYNVPHGMAVARLLVPVFRKNIDIDPVPYKRLAGLLAEVTGKKIRGNEEALAFLGEFVRQHLSVTTPLLPNLLMSSEVDCMATEAFNPDMSTNPVILTERDVIGIYREALN